MGMGVVEGRAGWWREGVVFGIQSYGRFRFLELKGVMWK